MASVLLTFLGRVSSKEKQTYQVTRYDFGDGVATPPVAFFGWPLQERLGTERLIIMGTAGSMWDHLFEGDLNFGKEGEEAREELISAVQARSVTREHLLPLAPLLAQRRGCEVRLEIIPYARNEAEQVELLRLMAAHVAGGDQVNLDVTHGFRHLPMLAILSAMHLRIVRQARIAGIWYGAFDPETKEAYVHNLVGLLHIADWVQALHTYDKDGDYGAFADLLGPGSRLLKDAAFYERTSNTVKAGEALRGWFSRDDRYPEQDATAELFRDDLEQRLSWIKGRDRANWENALAWQYLERGDYVRAAIYGMESAVSAEINKTGGNLNNRKARNEAHETLKQFKEFRTLSNIRNGLAHGVLAEYASITRILVNQKVLQTELRDLFKKLNIKPFAARG